VADHPLGDRLGQEEDRPVQLLIGVVVGPVVVDERLGQEQPGRVDDVDSSLTVLPTLSRFCPMITALPPAATTSVAVCFPIPLLPPTTTSFCPAKTCAGIHPSPLARRATTTRLDDAG